MGGSLAAIDFPRYVEAMTLRRSQESAARMSMRLEPSIDPSERRRWALTVIAVVGVLAVAAAGACWLTGAWQKPVVEIAARSSPHTTSEPRAPAAPAVPSKLVVGLPSLAAPPAQSVSPAPQQPPTAAPQAGPGPKAADPSKQLPSSVRF